MRRYRRAAVCQRAPARRAFARVADMLMSILFSRASAFMALMLPALMMLPPKPPLKMPAARAMAVAPVAMRLYALFRDKSCDMRRRLMAMPAFDVRSGARHFAHSARCLLPRARFRALPFFFITTPSCFICRRFVLKRRSVIHAYKLRRLMLSMLALLSVVRLIRAAASLMMLMRQLLRP